MPASRRTGKVATASQLRVNIFEVVKHKDDSSQRSRSERARHAYRNALSDRHSPSHRARLSLFLFVPRRSSIAGEPT